MSYITRSRKAAAVLGLDLDTRQNSKCTTTKNIVKNKDSKTKILNKKELKQNENLAPRIKYNESNLKNTCSKKLTSESRLQVTKKSNRLVNKVTLLSEKSPVLRDTTNAPKTLSNGKLKSQESNEIPVTENKKVQISNDKKLLSKVKILVKRCTKETKIEKTNLVNNNTEKNQIKQSQEKILKKNSSKEQNLKKITSRNQPKNNTVLKIEKSDDKQPQLEIFNNTLNSPNSNVIKQPLAKRKISVEYINELLNEEEKQIEFEDDKTVKIKQELENVNKVEKDMEPVENNQINKISEKIEESPIKKNLQICDLKTELINEKEANKNQISSKKFFKNKVNDNKVKVKSNFHLMKHPPQKVNNIKKRINKVDNNDDTFILKPLKSRKSFKPVEKKLRPRVNKNYCEISRSSQNFNINEKALINTEKSFEENKKILPVYKNIKSTDEIIKDKEEVYNFPDDSQEKEVQVNKKSKKSIKRLVRNSKQKLAPQILVSRPKQKENIKKKPFTVHFKDQNKKKVNKKPTVNTKNIQSYKNPEYFEDAGNTTIQELSTIKILSNTKLEGSSKIDLTVTPPIPKTITSELKLFGPRNAITSQPTSQYSNMLNHSLIRKSMSPISKLTDDFDLGSPWRPIDTFSRVKHIIQSTPQTNRLPLMREKKLPIHKINLIKKSISSDDTICVLSGIDKSLKQEENSKNSTLKKNDISPRKFGTVLSNLSHIQSKHINNTNNNSPIKNHESNLSSIQSQNIHNECSSPIKNHQSPMQIENHQSPMQIKNHQLPMQIENHQSPMQVENLQMNFSEALVKEKETTLVSKICNKENCKIDNMFVSPRKSSKKKFNAPSPFRFEKIHSSKKTVSVQSPCKQQISLVQEENEQIKSHEASLCFERSQSVILRQSNLNNFLNIEQMPEQTLISHGIFSEIHSTPKIEKKTKKPNFIEPTIENAFGFDDYDTNELSPIKNTSCGINICEKDANNKMKENNTKKTIKSILSSISKKTNEKMKKSVLKKKPEKTTLDSFLKIKEDDGKEQNTRIIEKVENNDEPQTINQTVLNSISFSDTFDILSEQQELKVPEKVPLFVDLEPTHFNQPPRRSYQKRKRQVNFQISINNNENEYSDCDDEPKPKKKKESKVKKETRKKINDWIKNINETFEEIDQFDLLVE